MRVKYCFLITKPALLETLETFAAIGMSSDDFNMKDEDEDYAPVKKKSRRPKPRLPPSLFWYIPTEVLKSKDGTKKLGR